MQVLVLGDSDSSGRHTGGVSWPGLLEASLAESSGGPVSVTSVGFSVVPDDAHVFAEKKMAQLKPDAVVLVLGSFGFTAGFVWLRVQQLFGKRAGRWYRRIEERFDDSTRAETGRLRWHNRLGRSIVRRVIGTKSFSTREKVTQNYIAVFRTLSRFEDSEVVILAYPGLGTHATEGKGPELRKLFFADMRAAAEEHHFAWVDGVKVFEGTNASEVKVDDLHFSAAGHGLMAAAVGKAIKGRATTHEP